MSKVFWYNTTIDGVPSNPIPWIQQTDRYLQRMLYEDAPDQFKCCHFDKVDPADDNYYIVSYYSPGEYPKYDTFGLHELRIFDQLENKDWLIDNENVTIVIDQSWEIGLWKEQEHKKLSNWIRLQKIRNGLLNHVILCRGITTDPNTHYKMSVIEAEFTLYIFGRMMSEQPIVIPQPKERPYLFQVYCAKKKIHRLAFLHFMSTSGYLEKSIWTYLDNTKKGYIYKLDGHDGWNSGVMFDQLSVDLPAIPSKKYNKIGTLHRPDFEILQAHHDCYVNIALETYYHFPTFEYQPTVFTEKTLKPLYAGQFFVVVGTPFTIQRLRELGFDVFDDVIDHTYDTIVNHEHRFNHIQKTIRDIVKKTDWAKTYEQCYDRMLFNQQHLIKIHKTVPLCQISSQFESIV